MAIGAIAENSLLLDISSAVYGSALSNSRSEAIYFSDEWLWGIRVQFSPLLTITIEDDVDKCAKAPNLLQD